jgi:hypothetical protein
VTSDYRRRVNTVTHIAHIAPGHAGCTFCGLCAGAVKQRLALRVISADVAKVTKPDDLCPMCAYQAGLAGRS